MATELRRGLSRSLVPILGVLYIFCHVGSADGEHQTYTRVKRQSESQKMLEDSRKLMENVLDREKCGRTIISIEANEADEVYRKVWTWFTQSFPFDEETAPRQESNLAIAYELKARAEKEKKKYKEVKDLARNHKRDPKHQQALTNAHMEVSKKNNFGDMMAEWLLIPLSQLKTQMEEVEKKQNRKNKKAHRKWGKKAQVAETRNKMWQRKVKEAVGKGEKVDYTSDLPDYLSIVLNVPSPADFLNLDALRKVVKVAELVVYTMLLPAQSAGHQMQDLLLAESSVVCDSIETCACECKRHPEILKNKKDKKLETANKSDCNKIELMIKIRDVLEAIVDLRNRQTFKKDVVDPDEAFEYAQIRALLGASGGDELLGASGRDKLLEEELLRVGHYQNASLRQLEYLKQVEEKEKSKDERTKKKDKRDQNDVKGQVAILEDLIADVDRQITIKDSRV